MAEVVFSRGIDAVCSAAEIDLVKIRFEYFALGAAALHLYRPPEFFYFALDGHIGTVTVQCSRNLLGERRTAAERKVKQFSRKRARYRLARESAVTIENAVFACDQRINHELRKIFQADDFPLFIRGKFSNEFAVYIKQLCGKRRVKGCDVFAVFNVACF